LFKNKGIQVKSGRNPMIEIKSKEATDMFTIPEK